MASEIENLYDPALVIDEEKQQAESLTCSICLDLMKDAHETECGHVFCQQCIIDSLKRGGEGECPDCRTALKVEGIRLSRFICRQILSLTVTCPKKDKGCQWSGPLKNITKKRNNKDYHFDSCGFIAVNCSLCGIEVLRKFLQSHESEECEQRHVKCSFCGNEMTQLQMIGHQNDCPSVKVQCPNNCGTLPSDGIKRIHMKTHQKDECPLQLIQCSHEQYGCLLVVKRIDLKGHEKVFEVRHLKMRIDFEKKKNSQLMDDFETERNQLLKRIEQLEQEDKQKQNEILTLRSIVEREPLHSDNKRSKLNNPPHEQHQQKQQSDSFLSPFLNFGSPFSSMSKKQILNPIPQKPQSSSNSFSSSSSSSKSSPGGFQPLPFNKFSSKPNATCLSHLSFPDGCKCLLGQSVVKKWLVQNNGQVAWPSDTKLCYMQGDDIGANREVHVGIIHPQEKVQICLTIHMPPKLGQYQAFYRLQSAGKWFGERIWFNIHATKDKNVVSSEMKMSEQSQFSDLPPLERLHDATVPSDLSPYSQHMNNSKPSSALSLQQRRVNMMPSEALPFSQNKESSLSVFQNDKHRSSKKKKSSSFSSSGLKHFSLSKKEHEEIAWIEAAGFSHDKSMNAYLNSGKDVTAALNSLLGDV